MKRLVIIIALSTLTIAGSMSLFSTTVGAVENNLYLKAESFTWEEFDDNGTKLLKESGPIYGLGYSIKAGKKALTFKGKAELFGGQVDYDGQTQAGVPVKTDTDYFGLKAEGDLGWKFMVTKNSSLEPFAGLGWRYWSRDIKDTNFATGYEELWSSFYARLGIRGDIVSSDRMKVFAEGGVKLPIYNENEADLTKFGIGKVTLEPGKEASAFAEIGLKWKMLKASVFYESMRFSKSDPVTKSGFIFWQPESKADIFGVTLGVAF